MNQEKDTVVNSDINKMDNSAKYLETIRMNYISLHNKMSKLYTLLSNEQLFSKIYDENIQEIINLDFNIDTLNMAVQTLLFNTEQIKNEMEQEGDFSVDETPINILDNTQTIIKRKNKEMSKMMQMVTPLLFYYFMKIDDDSIINSNTFSDNNENNNTSNYSYYNTHGEYKNVSNINDID
jgi:hypothetical protein